MCKNLFPVFLLVEREGSQPSWPRFPEFLPPPHSSRPWFLLDRKNILARHAALGRKEQQARIQGQTSKVPRFPFSLASLRTLVKGELVSFVLSSFWEHRTVRAWRAGGGVMQV